MAQFFYKMALIELTMARSAIDHRTPLLYIISEMRN